MALTPEEIQQRVEIAGRALQEIQNALGRDGAGGQVRFPAGYIKTVNTRTAHFQWIGDEALKRNICYHLIFADVLDWLLHRTNLSYAARDMVVKHVITVMGAVVEALTVAASRRLKLPVGKFSARLDRLQRAEAISEGTKTELDWLWTTRSRIHIHEVEWLEIDAYPEEESVRAMAAFRSLRNDLNNHFV